MYIQEIDIGASSHDDSSALETDSISFNRCVDDIQTDIRNNNGSGHITQSDLRQSEKVRLNEVDITVGIQVNISKSERCLRK